MGLYLLPLTRRTASNRYHWWSTMAVDGRSSKMILPKNYHGWSALPLQYVTCLRVSGTPSLNILLVSKLMLLFSNDFITFHSEVEDGWGSANFDARPCGLFLLEEKNPGKQAEKKTRGQWPYKLASYGNDLWYEIWPNTCYWNQKPKLPCDPYAFCIGSIK